MMIEDDRNGRAPRCCPGRLLSPKQASSLALSCAENWYPWQDFNPQPLRSKRSALYELSYKGVKC